jgi:hypothetical protein
MIAIALTAVVTLVIIAIGIAGFAAYVVMSYERAIAGGLPSNPARGKREAATVPHR